jgi:hexosaminidase
MSPAAAPPILPRPARLVVGDGVLRVHEEPLVERRTDPSLARMGAEGYAISVRPTGITLTAAAPTGMAYAEQTLRQLLEGARRNADTGAAALPCMEIEDAPRFAWRGFMLDEGRHFQGARQVMKMLDAMAALKMNVFHWHLTDDQGWRMEIRRYPLLAEVGSRREGTCRTWKPGPHDGVPHEGFYTQEEILAIVAYAAERRITVVPEIEMPGHSLAALAAYPRLGCTGGPYRTATTRGIFPDVLCVGKPETAAFMEGVLQEVMECFPGRYVHIGGDEALRDRWKACPACLALAREAGVAPGAVQVLFTNRMAAFLEANGRRAVGWDEILAPGLAPSAVAHCWRPGARRGREAAAAGRDVVLSPFFGSYLDLSYTLNTLRKAWRVSPTSLGFTEAERGRVLGIEAPLWSEFVWSPGRLDWQAFPRLLACAEAAWSGEPRDGYREFEGRVEAVLPSLRALGLAPAPRREWNPLIIKQLFGLITVFRAGTGGE